MTVVSTAEMLYNIPYDRYRDPVHLKDYVYRKFARYIANLAEIH